MQARVQASVYFSASVFTRNSCASKSKTNRVCSYFCLVFLWQSRGVFSQNGGWEKKLQSTEKVNTCFWTSAIVDHTKKEWIGGQMICPHCSIIEYYPGFSKRCVCVCASTLGVTSNACRLYSIVYTIHSLFSLKCVFSYIVTGDVALFTTGQRHCFPPFAWPAERVKKRLCVYKNGYHRWNLMSRGYLLF